MGLKQMIPCKNTNSSNINRLFAIPSIFGKSFKMLCSKVICINILVVVVSRIFMLFIYRRYPFIWTVFMRKVPSKFSFSSNERIPEKISAKNRTIHSHARFYQIDTAMEERSSVPYSQFEHDEGELTSSTTNVAVKNGKYIIGKKW